MFFLCTCGVIFSHSRQWPHVAHFERGRIPSQRMFFTESGRLTPMCKKQQEHVAYNIGFNSSSVINAKACRIKYFNLPAILPMVAVENLFADNHDMTSSLQKDLVKFSILTERSLLYKRSTVCFLDHKHDQ